MRKIFLFLMVLGCLCIVTAAILDKRLDSRNELIVRDSGGSIVYNMSETEQRFDSLKFKSGAATFNCEEPTNRLCLQNPIDGKNYTVVNDTGYHYQGGFAVDSISTTGDGILFCNTFSVATCPDGASIFIQCSSLGGSCEFIGVDCQFDFDGAINTSNKAVIGYDGGRADSDIERWIDFDGNNCDEGVYDIF